jgi:hypothetical protein
LKTNSVVALSGWKRSGKDMVANHLIEKHGFKRLAFADTLKEMTAEQYGVPLNSFYDQVAKECPLPQYPVNPRDDFSQTIASYMVREFKTNDGITPTRAAIVDSAFFGVVGDREYPLFFTPRALLILEGSVKRSVSTTYWVDRTLAKMQNDEHYVIPDLRYRSEIEAMESALGKVACVRIERWDTTDSVDPSERDLDDYPFKFKIHNRNVTRENVLDQTDCLLKAIYQEPPKMEVRIGGKVVGRLSSVKFEPTELGQAYELSPVDHVPVSYNPSSYSITITRVEKIEQSVLEEFFRDE